MRFSCLSLLVVCGIVFFSGPSPRVAEAAERPNILWITSEDNGPHLGCYGDDFADTPNIDRLAARGVIYLNCWSTAPVCAPARTTLISGLYPASTGSQHMRSMTRLPKDFHMYPHYLRQAGYYCTNNSKEDYNLQKEGLVWHDSSRKAHWKNRKPGQPFFAIFNHTVSHESQIRKRPHKGIHDPARVRVPAYHPDTEEVRRDWAQYYDKVTEMDAKVGKNLQELEQAGLADDTIVFYYGDHGSGMPRSKRWPYNSGLHVPLVVYIPPKFKHLAAPDYASGGKTDRLVGFIDFAPTLLSLADVRPPQHFQGFAFLGKFATEPQPYIYGFRGRMDERYDMVRTVRDKRYVYIRNYMPHKVYGQFIAYMFQTPTTRVWKELYDKGELSGAQKRFWQRKPYQELYDLEKDPDEVHNLADSPEHLPILIRMSTAHREHMLKIRDTGFLPEHQLHERSADSTPYEMGHDARRYSLREILEVAEVAAAMEPGNRGLGSMLKHQDSAIRYWAAMGLLMRGKDAVTRARSELKKALSDSAPSVRILAAQSLAEHVDADRPEALKVLLAAADLRNSSVYTAILALNAIDELDGRASSLEAELKTLPRRHEKVTRRMGAYVNNLLTKTLADLSKLK